MDTCQPSAELVCVVTHNSHTIDEMSWFSFLSFSFCVVCFIVFVDCVCWTQTPTISFRCVLCFVYIDTLSRLVRREGKHVEKSNLWNVNIDTIYGCVHMSSAISNISGRLLSFLSLSLFAHSMTTCTFMSSGQTFQRAYKQRMSASLKTMTIQ